MMVRGPPSSQRVRDSASNKSHMSSWQGWEGKGDNWQHSAASSSTCWRRPPPPATLSPRLVPATAESFNKAKCAWECGLRKPPRRWRSISTPPNNPTAKNS